AIAFAAYWLKYLRLVRESVRHLCSSLVYGLVALGVTLAILKDSQIDHDFKMIVGAAVGMIVFGLCGKRSRRMPTNIRKAVIDRDLTSKGKEWNPKEYEIDHKVPFSKGGSHTPDNLRAIPKKQNRRKGAKNPGFFEIFK